MMTGSSTGNSLIAGNPLTGIFSSERKKVRKPPENWKVLFSETKILNLHRKFPQNQKSPIFGEISDIKLDKFNPNENFSDFGRWGAKS